MIEFVRGNFAAVGRTTMSHPEHRFKITLYPMYHFGAPGFYKALYEDLRRFSVFLVEGVRLTSWKGQLYDLVARNMGLVTQRDHLCFPADAERIPLDMSDGEFTREAQALPIRWYLYLRVLRPFMWILTCTATGRQMVWGTFSKARYVRMLQERERPLDELTKTRRDQVMSDLLRHFACDERRITEAVPAAVIAGAAHMPALYARLFCYLCSRLHICNREYL